MFTDPQGDIARMSHKDNYNQMQSLGDALSRKGDDFDDPDFDEISPNLRQPRQYKSKTRNQLELEAIPENSPNRNPENNQSSTLIEEKVVMMYNDKDSSIRNINDQRKQQSQPNPHNTPNITNNNQMLSDNSSDQHILSMQSHQLKDHFERVKRAQQQQQQFQVNQYNNQQNNTQRSARGGPGGSTFQIFGDDNQQISFQQNGLKSNR